MYSKHGSTYLEINFKCPEPGIKGSVITFRGTHHHTALVEIEVFNCPNGFYHLNNKCIKWLAEDTLVKQHKICDLYRGKLLDTSPHSQSNVLLAINVMKDNSVTEIFNGKLKRIVFEIPFLFAFFLCHFQV